MTATARRRLLLPHRVLAAIPTTVPVALLRDGPRTIIAVAPAEILALPAGTGFATLDRLSGWWAGFIAYDAGRAVERVEPRAPAGEVPDILLARFDARATIDGHDVRLRGGGEGRRILERALHDAIAIGPLDRPALGAPRCTMSRTQFEANVTRILEHIRAGDCFQVNLARTLTWDVQADAVALAAACATTSPAQHEAFLRLAGIEVVSASPELFVRRDHDHIDTHPIKGSGSDPDTLIASEKDRAENVMIVDLARNDLGRVCVPGSIRVPTLCAAERLPNIVHLVSVVTGRIRPGIGFGTMLRAMFPPASVTGCPKPRVLQFIEDIERVRRGVAYGAIGWFDFERQRCDLNVAIRTFTILQGRTSLAVGAGIVADSDPSAEWDETELKARPLLAAAGALDPARAPA